MTGAEPVRLWTIYHSPVDLPGCPFVVREVHVWGGGRIVHGPPAVFATLQEARDGLPPQASVCVGRLPADPPVIVESWV